MPVVMSSFDYPVVASCPAYVMPLTKDIGTSLRDELPFPAGRPAS